MGHPQPPTPVQVDNYNALGISTGTIKQCKSKAMDTRFYWIRDRINQDRFNIYWKPGSTNRGDYFTKHFPPSHHTTLLPNYLHVSKYGKTSTLQGCVNLTLSKITLHTHARLLKAARMHTQKTARVYIDNPQKMRIHAHNSVHTCTIIS